ncbi:hypothetical protein ACHQM5_020424 [Ranunculus cassubicifolius]
MESSTPSSPVRVLTRPSSTTSITTSPSLSSSSSSSTLPSSSSEPHLSLISNPTPSPGVVVVGFIGCESSEDQLSQLINRILDDNVFGSGHRDTHFKADVLKDWFHFRKISYYYDDEKGVVFLQFASNWRDFAVELEDSVVEEEEFGDLQGMLLMFSFRMLQTAKHALAPFIKSHIQPLLTPKYSSLSQKAVGPISYKNSPPGRGGGISNRHSSAVSLMSGLGSYPSLFPGQCTPVLLFVFLDNFSETNASSCIDDPPETSSSNQSSNVSGLGRSTLPVKGSGSVIVLARPATKSEGGIRRKLQSSLDVQIRFLIKKCRTLAGSEGGHTGSRAGNVSSAPLFSLDASRAVALLDHSTNQKGDSLDFATSLLEEVLKSKATPDILLLESSVQDANKEDIQSLKEFIYRQSDTLRGRGGMLGANSSSAGGVGMVAVAAAAAAASVASGKPFSTPELPSMENWLSCSKLILDALLSAKHGYLDKNDIIKRKPLRRNAVAAQVERVSSGGIDPVEASLCWLESGKGLNMKFSTTWCQRALPAAKEVYLKDLPDCYPTSLHKSHLEKALHAFHTMVKGPAVQLFRKKLEDECTLIWRSGRQLCDAVSLTGKKCMHQRHNVEDGGPLLEAEVKPHSSGFVFLHACACGRSRRLREDPFDFDTANNTFNHFPDCDNLLPSLQPPTACHAGPIQSSSWSLMRVGGAKYYQPSKGLQQSGFWSTDKYLCKWSIYLEKKKNNGWPDGGVQKGSMIRTDRDSMVESISEDKMKKTSIAHLFQGEARGGVEKQKKNTEVNSFDDQKISFGRGLPNFTMRRPFAEVVAGSVATDAAFPPLQQRRHAAMNTEKTVKQKIVKVKSEEKIEVLSDRQDFKISEDVSSVPERSCRVGNSKCSDNEPLLQIGSYILPVTMNAGGKVQSNPSPENVVVYVGFEHECSHGHRFLLNPRHLEKLGPLYSLPEDSHTPPDIRTSEKGVESLNSSKRGARDNARTSGRSRQATVHNEHGDGLNLSSGSKNVRDQSSLSTSVNGLSESLQYASLDDGGCASSLLNMNLPLYMNCPHCMNSKKDQQKLNFADNVSQLQRIFLVTPPFPTVLGMCPVVQFEDSCLPPTVVDRELQSKFTLGCRVILPPDSFLSLRLPFVYGVQLDDKTLHPLKPLEHQPELTAWITKGTSLQVVSKESSLNEYNT